MVFCIAMIHGGIIAALFAFLLWSLPGAIGMYALSLGVQKMPDRLPPIVYALLSGMNASTVGIVALAAVQLAEKAIKDRVTRILVIFGACAGLCYNALWYFPVLIAIGGAVTVIWDVWMHQKIGKLRAGYAAKRRRARNEGGDAEETTAAQVIPPTEGLQVRRPEAVKRKAHTGSSTDQIMPVEEVAGPSQFEEGHSADEAAESTPRADTRKHNFPVKTGVSLIVGFLLSFIVVMVIRGTIDARGLAFDLFVNMYLAGTIIFGGGPVVIPLLRSYVVDPGWVSPRDFLLGLAIIQAFPGPNFNFSVYLGALTLASTSVPTVFGALLAFLAIFFPGLILAVGVQSIWQALRTKAWVLSLLRGINAAAVGLVFTAVYRLWEIGYLTPESNDGKSLAQEPWWVVVAAVTYAETAWFGVPPAVAIILGAVLGLGWYGTTSPLLPKLNDNDANLVDTGINVSPEGTDFNADAQQDGGDIERQVSNGDASKHQGLPEVRKRMKYIFPALAIGVFLASADQTLVISTYGTIGTDLHALSSTSWIATGYFLTLSAFQPLFGKLSDIFGRKQCLLSAYLIFGIGSTCCGLARNMGELIAARAFAGIGGGGMSVVGSILLSDIMTIRERGLWQGYINVIYAFGAATGAPVGGLLADSIGWRWPFIAQGPMCLVAIIAVALVLDLPKQDHSHWKDKLMKIDFLGAAILLVAVFGLLVGLDRGSNVSWSNPITIAGLCTTPLFIVFVLVEKYVAKNPFAPGHIILNRSLFACYLCNFFSFGGWLASLFFIPLYWQVTENLSAARAGLLLVPSIICGVSGSLFGGVYMKKTAKYYWITVISYTNLTIGISLILLAAGTITRSLPLMVVGTCICAFSNGLGVTTTLIGLISNASHADQAVATACSYLFRSLGSVFGVSMCATAFNQTLRKSLQNSLEGDDAAEIAERVRAGLSYFRSLEPHIQDIVRECYGQATRAALAVGISLVAGSALFAWFIREKKLSL
ncbi:MFS general substrate transporter [Ophiobolus disseminans]|uniref:MFS general substrate transporter n=1 Tax=Ophiobolus disseminans TaxID=1469910 RepID=A0A6A6ZT95_9PLEO|nr:MFS general substrate transporter [Ophiobolus disseminans]